MRKNIEEKVKEYYEKNRNTTIYKENTAKRYETKSSNEKKRALKKENNTNTSLCKMSDIIKTVLFWLIVILFLEFSFRISMKYEFKGESFINILLFSLILANLFSIVFQSFKKLLSTILTSIFIFILAILFCVQCVFFNIFKTYFSLSSLELGDQVGGFLDQAISKILGNALFIFIFFIPFFIYLIIRKFLKLKRNKRANYIVYFVSICVCIVLLTAHILSTKEEINGSYQLYHDVNIIALNNEKFGVIHSYLIDLYRYIVGFEEEIAQETSALEYYEENDKNQQEEIKEVKPIVYEYNMIDLDFEQSASNNEVKKINDYLKNDSPTQQNKYTGIFDGYNIVYITAESFYETAIDEELTPTLYKITHSGFVFNNYYTPTVLSTIGGEFQSLTGLYPSKDILSTWRTGKNYFPYGLATVFEEKGYNTYAYHNHNYTFQDRHKYLKSQGFDNYLAVNNGLEKKINSRLWPESDIEMMEATIPDYIDDKNPFLAYYMTVSGHMDYNFSGGNAMSTKNKKYVKDLDLPEVDKAYIATQIELDRALEKLIDELDEAGKLDNTVFVMLADHYPYALSLKDINKMSSYKRDDVVEINHNALVIWNSKMDTVEINKVCMSVDVLPTVLNLFGIEYDSRLLTGKDILSNTGGLAIFENRSWVSDKGTYFSASGKFVAKDDEDVDSDYIENVNNIVKNRLNIAKWIVKNNYYEYLMK